MRIPQNEQLLKGIGEAKLRKTAELVVVTVVGWVALTGTSAAGRYELAPLERGGMLGSQTAHSEGTAHRRVLQPAKGGGVLRLKRTPQFRA